MAWIPVASWLAKRPLKSNGRLANIELNFLSKERPPYTKHNWEYIEGPKLKKKLLTYMVLRLEY